MGIRSHVPSISLQPYHVLPLLVPRSGSDFNWFDSVLNKYGESDKGYSCTNATQIQILHLNIRRNVIQEPVYSNGDESGCHCGSRNRLPALYRIHTYSKSLDLRSTRYGHSGRAGPKSKKKLYLRNQWHFYGISNILTELTTFLMELLHFLELATL